MKNKFLQALIFILLITALTSNAFSQTNQTGIIFQGIAKDNFDTPAKEKKIFIESSILHLTATGSIVLSEIHETTTSTNGIFSISIGNGSKTGGTVNNINNIDWANGPYYLALKMAIQPDIIPTGWDYTKNWTILGATLFGTVPYALYANTSGVGNLKNNLSDSILNKKLNNTDTAGMLAPYRLALLKNNTIMPIIHDTPTKPIDTNSLSTRINEKVNITDTSVMLNNYALKSQLFSRDYIDLLNQPLLFDKEYTSLLNRPTLFDGNYNNLTNKPILFSGSYADVTNKPTLFSGNYNDLTNQPLLFDKEYTSLLNRPTLFDGNYNSLSNAPTLFDGNYNNLTNKPILFSGSYADLTNKPNTNLIGDVTSVGTTTTLSISGVVTGTYGNALSIPIITIDSKGRVTAASNTLIPPTTFLNKTHAEKLALTATTGMMVWCSNCGTRGQMQVYNGFEWTDLTGAAGLTNGIILNAISLSSISSSSATATNSISSDGGATITAKGVVWSSSVHPTIALSTKTNDGTGTSNFTSSISSLTASTVYYVRSYATNANGTVYGNEISFTSSGEVPILTTNANSNISLSTGTTGGNITSEGGASVVYRGVCWSTSSTPTINDNKINNGAGVGSYNITLSGLSAGTTYYIRAYAINSAGTGYGNVVTLTTNTLSIGTVYLGGKVAYIFQSGDPGYNALQMHGFIISYNSLGTASFGNSGLISTSTNFGSGYNNTSQINNSSYTPATAAAKMVFGLDLNGYSDWYLPSEREWNKIVINAAAIGLPAGYYNTSSQLSSTNAYVQLIYADGTYSVGGNSGKTSVYNVRAIRNF